MIKDAKMRIPMAEVPGASLKKGYRSPTLSERNRAENVAMCMFCGDGDDGRCRREGMAFEVRYKGCEGRYIGETSRYNFTRGLEHRSG